MTRVLIAATSSVVRAGLETIIDSAPALEVVGALPHLAGLADHIEALQPDVLLLVLEPGTDPTVPGSAGTGGDQSPAIVLLTDDAEGAEAVEALRSGARAVLPRDAQREEIVAAVGAAAVGLVVLHIDLTTPLLPHLTPVARAVPVAGGEHLTPREIEVLHMIAEGAGNKSIARRLGISEHTVKFHVGSIMAKLDAASRTEAVTLGLRRGLILL